MHSKTIFIFLNFCMVRNLKMQSGMLDWYIGALPAVKLAIFAWEEEKHQPCNAVVCKFSGATTLFLRHLSSERRQQLTIAPLDAVCPSQHSKRASFTGLASTEAQADFSVTLHVYVIRPF